MAQIRLEVDIAPPRTTTTIEFVVLSDEELEKPYRVIIENDDITPMEFVVVVLRVFFQIESHRAYTIMLEAHHNGRAHVVTLSFEEAKQRIYAAHSAAREANYPLTFYMEPDE
jgi:ATP-dependent Clp protease adaptor protein ClpS